MMNFWVVTAHGALGYWDELIFLGVGIGFLVMMGVSWFKSRNAIIDEETGTETPLSAPSQTDLLQTEEEAPASDRFRLD